MIDLAFAQAAGSRYPSQLCILFSVAIFHQHWIEPVNRRARPWVGIVPQEFQDPDHLFDAPGWH